MDFQTTQTKGLRCRIGRRCKSHVYYEQAFHTRCAFSYHLISTWNISGLEILLSWIPTTAVLPWIPVGTTSLESSILLGISIASASLEAVVLPLISVATTSLEASIRPRIPTTAAGLESIVLPRIPTTATARLIKVTTPLECMTARGTVWWGCIICLISWPLEA